MSIGLQRLREEPDRIRQGAIDKGEDPSIVDAALVARRARAAACSASRTVSRPSATPRRKQIGDAIRAGAAPNGPEVAALRQASVDAGDADRQARRRAGRRRARSSRS